MYKQHGTFHKILIAKLSIDGVTKFHAAATLISRKLFVFSLPIHVTTIVYYSNESTPMLPWKHFWILYSELFSKH